MEILGLHSALNKLIIKRSKKIMYYARIDETKKVDEIFCLTTAIHADNFIQVLEQDSAKVGQYYVDGTFVDTLPVAETITAAPEVVSAPVETVANESVSVVAEPQKEISSADVMEMKADLATISGELMNLGGYVSTLSNKVIDMAAVLAKVDGYFVPVLNPVVSDTAPVIAEPVTTPVVAESSPTVSDTTPVVTKPVTDTTAQV